MPTILPPGVRVPSAPATLFSFIIFVIYLSCEKNENKQKEAGFGPFFLKKIADIVKVHLQDVQFKHVAALDCCGVENWKMSYLCVKATAWCSRMCQTHVL